jgi:hypothetical protein
MGRIARTARCSRRVAGGMAMAVVRQRIGLSDRQLV